MTVIVKRKFFLPDYDYDYDCYSVKKTDYDYDYSEKNRNRLPNRTLHISAQSDMVHYWFTQW
jgi:hypothetical protein